MSTGPYLIGTPLMFIHDPAGPGELTVAVRFAPVASISAVAACACEWSSVVHIAAPQLDQDELRGWCKARQLPHKYCQVEGKLNLTVLQIALAGEPANNRQRLDQIFTEIAYIAGPEAAKRALPGN